MTSTKKYSVKSDLSALLDSEEAEEFSSLLPEIKDECRCLHGCGVDYSREGIKSFKLYYKIFGDIGNNEFILWFFNEDHFKGGRKLYEDNLRTKSKDINSSLGGLGGINFALKLSKDGSTTYSFYIKQRKNQAKVYNFNNEEVTERTYRYVFNKYLIRLLTRYYNVKIPTTGHGIEYSVRNNKLFCTIYPDYRLKDLPLPNFFNRLYAEVSNYNAWEIEEEILSEINEKYRPVTKGFCSGDSLRKIFFGRKEDLEKWNDDRVAHAVLNVKEFLNPELEVESQRNHNQKNF